MAEAYRYVWMTGILLAFCFTHTASANYLNEVSLSDLNGSYSYGDGAVSQTVFIEEPPSGPWWGVGLVELVVAFEVQGTSGSDSVLGEVLPEFVVSVRDPEGGDLIEATTLGPIGEQVMMVKAANYWTRLVVGFSPPNVSGDYEVTLEIPEATAGMQVLPGLDVLSGSLTARFRDYGFVGLEDLDAVLLHWNQLVEPYNFSKGEYTGDGFVGLDDLDVVLANWNEGTPPADTGEWLYDCFPEDPGCGGGGYFGLADLDLVLNNWNLPSPPADPQADWDGDSYIGLGDLDVILTHWNTGIPPVAVPEPAGVGLLLLGCGVLAGRRRVG